MTGLLKDLMHERADSIGDPELDLASITRTGERRIRRRRTTWAVGVAASALVATAIGGALLPGDGGSDSAPDVASDGTATEPRELAWVTGSTLHRTGQPDADLGSTVRAWVMAGDTVVFTDMDRRVHVWTDGTDTVVGRTIVADNDHAELVGDGWDAAWVDAERGLTRYDVGIGEASWVPLSPGRTAPRVTALDVGVVYAVDARGVVKWDLAEGRARVVDPDPSRAVLDAENGSTVQLTGDGQARVTGAGRELAFPIDSFANLSPDATMVTVENDDEGVLLEVATGDRYPLDTGHEWALPHHWLDDDTVAVLAFDGIDGAEGDMRAFLQACEVDTGDCDGPGVELPSGLGTFQLPNGVHFSE